MSWDGYNFEDAIIISEELVKNDTYTSIHIEEFDVEIRETKLGREEFTRDIPNVSEKVLRNLDENGIVRIGTFVEPGDILVGKVSPKSKTELTPEEKLLHAIFGRAGEDVKNDSLEVPSGVEGIVIDTQKFSRRMSLSEDERKEFEKELKEAEKRRQRSDRRSVSARWSPRWKTMLGRKLTDDDGNAAGRTTRTRSSSPSRPRSFKLDAIDIRSPQRKKDVEKIYKQLWPAVEEAIDARDRKLNCMKRGDELRSGVLQMVKVYIATKRVISVGDKMAGRHGNKGVIAKILPVEDMPFLADGTPVQIMLNPLGVPSRMNVGQILETHLGWAGAKLGFQAITPVFDGADGRGHQRRAGRGRLAAGTARRSCTTAAPASRSSRRPRSASSTCSSCTTWSTTRCTPAARARTRSSRSSRWAARPGSAASGSAKWKSGRWKPTAPRTSCRSCSPSRATTSKAAPRFTNRWSKARTRSKPARRPASTCLTNEIRGLGLNMQLEKRRI